MLTTLPGVPAVLAESEAGKAGPVGLLVIIVLCLAVFMLGRSMFTHLRRVPASFDEPAQPGGAAPDGVGADEPATNDGDTGRG